MPVDRNSRLGQSIPSILWVIWLTLPWVNLPNGLAASVRINELSATNDSILADEEGDFSDWIELFNLNPGAIDLRGYGLSDDPKKPFKWSFAQSTPIAADSHLVVFASGKNRQNGTAVALDPATLPGLRLHLSAGSIATNNSQQVRSSAAGLWVTSWRNRIAGQSAASQTDPTAQPRYIPQAVHGRPALRFDGQNDRLRWPRSLATNSFTLFAVLRTSTPHEIDPESPGGVGGTSGQRWLFGANHGGDLHGGVGVSVGTNGVSVYEHGSGYMPALAVSPASFGTGWNVLTVTYDQKKPTIALCGRTVRTGVTSPRTEVWAPTDIGAGAYGAFAGEIAEILIFDRTLDERERQAVDQYLMDQYSITSSHLHHTNFKLDADGETLVLTAPNGTSLDTRTFGPSGRNVSQGLQPDGTGSWLLFAQPTPGSKNQFPGASTLLGPVQYSLPGGFYTNAILLTLSVTNQDAIIRFTTDGTEPDEHSPQYAEPLNLISRHNAPNSLSNIRTADGWQPPAATVFKGWVVRARAYRTDALPGPARANSYFISPRGPSRYSVPVVSLSTARANFFDPAIGIYVPGTSGMNFSQRGPLWERPVFVELYETNGFRVLAQEALISIHGNTSQGFPIKGLDLDAEGGPERRPFQYQFFPDRSRTVFNNLLLRPSGHDNYLAFQRDEFMQDLMHETGAESQEARLAVVFLNGEYWGLHYLKEKQDKQFVRHYSGLTDVEFDYLEGYAAPKDGDTVAWDALMQILRQQNPANSTVYGEIQRRIDVANYIDYKAAEIFTYRWDIGNHRFWRPRTEQGRFRWLQFDNDVGWGGFWAVAPAWDFNMLQAVLETSGSLNGHNNEATTFLLRKLLENPEFRRSFVLRFADLLNSIYRPEYTIARIDQFSRSLEPEMAEHAQRWRSPGSISEWRNNVQFLRTYANRRPAAMRQHLRQRFTLGPNVTLRASVQEPNHGEIQLNSLTLTNSTDLPWTGIYFQNQMIRLRAKPRPGFRFARWEGLPGVHSSESELPLSTDLTVTAHFEPERARLEATFQNGRWRVDIVASPSTSYVVQRSSSLVLWSQASLLNTDESGRASLTFPPDSGPQFVRLALP